ncbi:hypothetical protein [Bacteroides reticulotermitis]|uniref:hypothetical protein n=1 Tax=Bacteroides reticulotermitis TaxID=1133319 RepID=UPI003A8B70B9
MIRKLYTILLIGLCLNLVACGDDHENVDPNAAAPVIKFPMEQLDVDLNKVDNLPVVAVVKSQAGLRSVTMKIQTTEGTVDYKTVTDFFNPNSYSLSERVEYEANFQAFVIEATDKLNHVVTETLPIVVTDVVERPAITFDPAEIVYDEMEENPTIPRTTFKVTSEAGLKKVEMYLVSVSGQVSKGTAELNNEAEYNFDEMIDYKEGDKGFKVKAEDTYGYITIATLPVTYKTIPGPELTLADQVIFADTDVKTGVNIQAESVRGVHEVVIYRIENGQEVEAYREQKNGEHALNYTPKIDLTESTSQLKVVVSDGRAGKEAIGYVKTYVNMDVATVHVGSQPLANNAHDKFPDAFGMLSFNDMKTYSIDYAISSEANAKNVDLKFYCFGGAGVPRLYSMDNTEKDSEFNGSTGKLSTIKAKNMTRFATLTDFDFDNATVTSISEILSSSISISKLTPFAVGDVIAFRTGSSSTAGGARIGVMKVVSMTEPKELLPSNATARVMTLEIKFPKKK